MSLGKIRKLNHILLKVNAHYIHNQCVQMYDLKFIIHRDNVVPG
jgi:hypothetical protein